MGKTIILPTFGIKEDDEIVKLFEGIFEGSNIYPIDSNEIANDGGFLNCITWNILK
jgi:agmatine deiminase